MLGVERLPISFGAYHVGGGAMRHSIIQGIGISILLETEDTLVRGEVQCLLPDVSYRLGTFTVPGSELAEVLENRDFVFEFPLGCIVVRRMEDVVEVAYIGDVSDEYGLIELTLPEYRSVLSQLGLSRFAKTRTGRRSRNSLGRPLLLRHPLV